LRRCTPNFQVMRSRATMEGVLCNDIKIERERERERGVLGREREREKKSNPSELQFVLGGIVTTLLGGGEDGSSHVWDRGGFNGLILLLHEGLVLGLEL